jgi:hypothetical protein
VAVEYEFYEKLYDEEWARRDAIQSSAGVPIGVLTLIGGAVSVLVQHIDGAGRVLAFVFWGGFLVTLVGFARSCYFLIRCFIGPKYERVPLPSAIFAYHHGLREHYSALRTPLQAEEDFDSFLVEHYIQAADRNAVNNVNRGEYLYKANRSLVATLVAAAVCAVPVGLHMRSAPRQAQEVRIVNLVQERPLVAQNGSQTPKAANVPPKPVPPSNITVRTGMKLPPRN